MKAKIISAVILSIKSNHKLTRNQRWRGAKPRSTNNYKWNRNAQPLDVLRYLRVLILCLPPSHLILPASQLMPIDIRQWDIPHTFPSLCLLSLVMNDSLLPPPPYGLYCTHSCTHMHTHAHTCARNREARSSSWRSVAVSAGRHGSMTMTGVAHATSTGNRSQTALPFPLSLFARLAPWTCRWAVCRRLVELCARHSGAGALRV